MIKQVKKIKLNQSQFKALSTITANFSEVALASMVIPTFVDGLDNLQLNLLILGIVSMLGSVVASLYFAKRGKL